MIEKIYCKKKLPKNSKRNFLRAYFHEIQPETYDCKTKKIQCLSGKNRSIGDLKMLLDGTFKSTTKINDVICLLMSLFEAKMVRSLFCMDVNKVVFYSPLNPKGYWSYHDLGFGVSIGIDGYSWSSINKIYKNKLNG